MTAEELEEDEEPALEEVELETEEVALEEEALEDEFEEEESELSSEGFEEETTEEEDSGSSLERTPLESLGWQEARVRANKEMARKFFFVWCLNFIVVHYHNREFLESPFWDS